MPSADGQRSALCLDRQIRGEGCHGHGAGREDSIGDGNIDDARDLDRVVSPASWDGQWMGAPKGNG